MPGNFMKHEETHAASILTKALRKKNSQLPRELTFLCQAVTPCHQSVSVAHPEAADGADLEDVFA